MCPSSLHRICFLLLALIPAAVQCLSAAYPLPDHSDLPRASSSAPAPLVSSIRSSLDEDALAALKSDPSANVIPSSWASTGNTDGHPGGLMDSTAQGRPWSTGSTVGGTPGGIDSVGVDSADSGIWRQPEAAGRSWQRRQLTAEDSFSGVGDTAGHERAWRRQLLPTCPAGCSTILQTAMNYGVLSYSSVANTGTTTVKVRIKVCNQGSCMIQGGVGRENP